MGVRRKSARWMELLATDAEGEGVWSGAERMRPGGSERGPAVGVVGDATWGCRSSVWAGGAKV